MAVMKNTKGTRKIAAMAKIETAPNFAAILSPQWTSGSTGDGFDIERKENPAQWGRGNPPYRREAL
jgi:hypothetical protein